MESIKDQEMIQVDRENQDRMFTAWANKNIDKYKAEGKHIGLLIKQVDPSSKYN